MKVQYLIWIKRRSARRRSVTAAVAVSRRMIDCANIVISTGCNNSCIWCYAKGALEDNHKMSLTTFDTILSRLVQVGCKNVVFTGGEPTLHPLLPAFIKKALADHIEQVYVVSNGSGFTNKFLNELDTYKKSVRLNVSLHGATSAIHDSITQTPGSYDKLISSIKQAQANGFKVSAQITLCRENRTDLPNVLQLLKSFHISSVLINYCSKPINVKFREDDFLTVQEFSESVATAVNLHSGSIHIEIGPPLPRCRLSSAFKELLNYGVIRLNTGCGLISNKVIINPKGNLLLCTHLHDIILNNIATTEDFQQLLDEIDAVIKQPLRKYPLKECIDCKEQKECIMGGCPILWFKNQGEKV